MDAPRRGLGAAYWTLFGFTLAVCPLMATAGGSSFYFDIYVPKQALWSFPIAGLWLVALSAWGRLRIRQTPDAASDVQRRCWRFMLALLFTAAAVFLLLLHYNWGTRCSCGHFWWPDWMSLHFWEDFGFDVA